MHNMNILPRLQIGLYIQQSCQVADGHDLKQLECAGFQKETLPLVLQSEFFYKIVDSDFFFITNR